MIRWPWTREGPAKDDLRQVLQRLEDLESAHRRLKAEWVDMYEKLTSRDERLRKREARSEAAGDTNGQLAMPEVVGNRKSQLRARARALGVL